MMGGEGGRRGPPLVGCLLFRQNKIVPILRLLNTYNEVGAACSSFLTFLEVEGEPFDTDTSTAESCLAATGSRLRR